MSQRSDCVFCAIVAGEGPAREVLRTDRIVAFFPLDPVAPGHTLVVPHSHAPDIWSIDRDTGHALMDATLEIAEAVRRALPIDGLNVIQSNGEAATQSVPHLHIHVVPRQWGDAMDIGWPSKTNWGDGAIDAAQDKLRAVLGQR
ncbi:HIT family protein [Phytohabitans aurantiacus]|uniref:HIT family protein n=1 Tax=Phytohabitans aurantiacus TaxID=3016789 RepID=UPI002492C4F8|nr:HIT domain-containing protein [Phytohabitans aurantiacus]